MPDEPLHQTEEQPNKKDRSDQLSPGRALRNSLGSSLGQRVGDSGPLANPIVSFPDAPGEEEGEQEEGR